MVICRGLGADLHMAQLMPLPLTVSCFNKIQIGFTFLVPAHPGSPGQRAVKRVCVCVCVSGPKPGARFTKYLTTVLRSSYDIAEVTIDLYGRLTYGTSNAGRKAFLGYDSLAKS